jgi:hypothetical protein
MIDALAMDPYDGSQKRNLRLGLALGLLALLYVVAVIAFIIIY